MAKYGWTKGSGLGADEDGITSALRVQVEKRRKRPDAEGGGFAEPGGRGKIIAGKQPKSKPSEDSEDAAKHGKTSSVIVLRNMLEGMPNLEAEIEAGLGQEIGEECGDKYGRVERLYIEPTQRLVFIKFTDQVSALRVSLLFRFITSALIS
jgi:splicing factor 45